MTIDKQLTPQEHQEALDAFKELRTKYESLVWYARKAPMTDQEYWKDVPQDVKMDAYKAMINVASQYPDEVKALRSPETGDWEHGFNSGCLAAFRLVLMTLVKQTYADGETFGGLEMAIDEFPMLDT